MNPDDLGGRQWCEHAVPRFLPGLRAHVARSLSRQHGLTQEEIADHLGVTQAAVSHYLTRRRGRGWPQESRLRQHAEKLAGRVADGLSGPRLTAAICGACTSFRQTEGVGPCRCVLDGVSRPEFLFALGEKGGFPRQPCENLVVERLLPYLRSQVAHRLAAERGQTETAEILGVSQPAVSQYLTTDRGQDRELEGHPAVEREVDGLTRAFREGMADAERRETLCAACTRVRRDVLQPEAEPVLLVEPK